MADYVGTPGADDFTGTLFSDHFSMDTGQDIMRPRQVEIGGIDICDGGGGIDFVEVVAGSETEAVTVSVGGAPHFIVTSVSGRIRIDAFNTELLNFHGGSGNDTVNSDAGGSLLYGNRGIDKWIANYSAVTQRIIFRLGLDTSINVTDLGHIESFELMDLTTGSGNDFIGGGSRSDVIVTNDGNDYIDAGKVEKGGFDFVSAGNGIDTLNVDASGETGTVTVNSGGAPRYSIQSESGMINIAAHAVEKLRFKGGTGDDIVNSDTGGEQINGGFGTDWWIADYSARGQAIDFELGQTGDLRQVGLTLIDGIERISLKTGSGNDSIIGGARSDIIETNAGNDIVNARTVEAGGLDRVFAGGGNDLLVVDAASETKSVTLFLAGSPRYIIHSVSGRFNVEAFDTERVQFTGGSGNDTIFTGDGGERLDGGAGIDQWNGDLSGFNADMHFILGVDSSIGFTSLKSIFRFEQMNLKTGNGDDRITGGNLSDQIETGAGRDTLNAKGCEAGGLDRLFGGDGNDLFVVDARSDTEGVQLFVAGSPRYAVRSVTGRFNLEAFSIEKVSFTGGAGDDEINTGDGGVIVNGGRGSDFWSADLSAVNRNITFVLGETTAIAPAGITRISGIERISLTTGRGDDAITGGNLSDDIRTGRGNDAIDLGIVAAGGLDRAFGDEGFDTLVVDASTDRSGIRVTAHGSPNFVVHSGSGRYNVEGYGIERVNATGGFAGDLLNGGDSADIFDGKAGADTIAGGLGADTLTGGAGADLFVYSSLADSRGNAADRITDFAAIDRIDLSAIDANTVLGGDQAFRFIGGAHFQSRPGELRYAGGRVFGDTSGDAIADFIIFVPGDTALNRGDFVL